MNMLTNYCARVSYASYVLFNEIEWINLLRINNVDLDRHIRYSTNKYSEYVYIFYDDTFIGENI